MIARARSSVYNFLACAFASAKAGTSAVGLDALLTELPESLRQEVERLIAVTGNNGNLARIYQRLFIGPTRPRVYPYESCYRDPSRRVAGPWATQVAAQYARESLTTAGLLPDHIAAELAFLAHLVAREADARAANDQTAAGQYREQQAAFLQQHLLVWAPEFCWRLQGETDHPFFVALARLLSTWLELEAVHFGLQDAADSAPAYPTAVVVRLCTLCDVCTEACPTAALCSSWVDGEVRLTLEPDGCTGCRICAQVCPFKALRLSDKPVAGVLMCSPLLPCPDCGRPALPLAFWQRLARRLDPSGLAAVAARRCPACKQSRAFRCPSDERQVSPSVHF